MNENGNRRGYSLMLVPFWGGEDYSFPYLTGRNLEELDSFTCNFDDLKEMMSSINYHSGEKYDIIDSYIKRINSKRSTRYEVMYRGDQFDSSRVISFYREYLLAHPKYFREHSPVSKIHLFQSDYELESTYITACCFAYFNKKNNYREVRGAYFELKKLGLANKVLAPGIQPDSEDYEYYSKDPYIDQLLNDPNGPNWEEIHNYLSREEFEKLVKKVPWDRKR